MPFGIPKLGRDKAYYKRGYVLSACLSLIMAGSVWADDGSKLGNVQFETTCTEPADAAFNRGLALLHHMMYFQADAHFAAATARNPDCAMLHWGAAMSRFHPLWPGGPAPGAIEKGRTTVKQMKAAAAGSEVESAFAAAVSAFYEGEDTGYRDRIAAWASSQKSAYEQFPENEDAIALYALSRLATAPRGDKTMSVQREVGAMLEKLNETTDLHPGVYHYAIHAYDNAALYERGLPFAEAYGNIASETAHALHMPSHIFVRAGHWDQVIEWNQRSASAALAHKLGDMISSHYAHAMDYMIYAHLQRGEFTRADDLLAEFVGKLDQQSNFGSAYALAASPVRAALEQSQWAELAALSSEMHPAIAWDRFPQAVAMRWFAIGLGAARSGDTESARNALVQLADLRAALEANKQGYWLKMLDANALSIEAWVEHANGDSELAISLQTKAADIEDAAGKSPVTPGHVLPARELLGDLFSELGHESDAKQAYETVLSQAPNRRRSMKALE